MKLCVIFSLFLVFVLCDGQAQQIPYPVSHVSAIATNSTSVRVTWSPGNEVIPVEQYVLGYGEGNPDVIQLTLPAFVHSCVLNNLNPDSDYVISVRAENKVGRSRATYILVHTRADNESGGQAQQIPHPVAHVSALATTSTSVRVEWSPRNEDIPVEQYGLGFGEGIPDVIQLTLPACAHFCVLNNLMPDSEYVISLRAENDVGVSKAKYRIVHTPPDN